MCDHVDSPYIRGIGFLYLRYRYAYCNFLGIKFYSVYRLKISWNILSPTSKTQKKSTQKLVVVIQ